MNHSNVDMREFVLKQMETSETFDTIIRILQKHDGKIFDQNVIDEIKGSVHNANVSYTYVEDCGPERPVGVASFDPTELFWEMDDRDCKWRNDSMLISGKSDQIINMSWIKNTNIGLFFYAQQLVNRNAVRMELLKNPDSFFQNISNVINDHIKSLKTVGDLIDGLDKNTFVDISALRYLIHCIHQCF